MKDDKETAELKIIPFDAHESEKLKIIPSEDSITHINVWSKGKTELGRSLSNFAHTPFKLPVQGFFASVEGYWYWLSSGGSYDHLRRLYGFSAKSAGSKLETVPMEELEFQDAIKKAMAAKIEQNENLKVKFIQSRLPLVHYLVYGKNNEIVVYKQKHQWQMDFLMEYRDKLQRDITNLAL